MAYQLIFCGLVALTGLERYLTRTQAEEGTRK